MRYYTTRGKFRGVHPDLARIGIKEIKVICNEEKIEFIFEGKLLKTFLTNIKKLNKISSKNLFLHVDVQRGNQQTETPNDESSGKKCLKPKDSYKFFSKYSDLLWIHDPEGWTQLHRAAFIGNFPRCEDLINQETVLSTLSA